MYVLGGVWQQKQRGLNVYIWVKSGHIHTKKVQHINYSAAPLYGLQNQFDDSLLSITNASI